MAVQSHNPPLSSTMPSPLGRLPAETRSLWSDPVLDLDQSHYATRALHSAADPGTDDHASMSEPWERMRRTVLDIMPAVDARCTAVERDVAWGAVGVVEKPDNGDTRELMGERLGWKESVVQDTDLTGIDRRMGRRGGAPHV
ncbi:hypothetical protein BST61_g6988 [Cercospora zeina]